MDSYARAKSLRRKELELLNGLLESEENIDALLDEEKYEKASELYRKRTALVSKVTAMEKRVKELAGSRTEKLEKDESEYMRETELELKQKLESLSDKLAERKNGVRSLSDEVQENLVKLNQGRKAAKGYIRSGRIMNTNQS